MSDEAEGSPPDKVGYKRPPREHRFKKGQSGNPSGRPKRARTMAAAAEKILAQTVTMRHDGRVKRMPLAEALWNAVVQKVLSSPDLKGFPSLVSALKSAGCLKPSDVAEGMHGVLVVPPVSVSGEEWEREHGAAAKGKPPPPEATAPLALPAPPPPMGKMMPVFGRDC